MRKPSQQLLPLGVALCGVLLFLLPCTPGARAEFEFNDEFEDLIADESYVDEDMLPPGSVLLPSDVFNDGKPFFVERDPSTGAIDFNHKKTGNQIDAGLGSGKLQSEATKDSYVSDKKDVIVHQSTPNFHDFLNLPKMYSPENFVSISSSYANLKYQGSNKGGSSNHREHSAHPHIVAATSATPAPTSTSTTTTTTTTVAPPVSSSTIKYFHNRPQYTSGGFNRGTTSAGGGGYGSYYKFPATSGRPITTSSSTPSPPTTTTTTATTTTTSTTTTEPPPPATDPPKTTLYPQKQLVTRYPYKSTIKNKYLETSEQTRKKFFLPSTLALPGPTTTTSTTTTTTTTTTPAPVRTSSTYFAPSSSRPHWPAPSQGSTGAPSTPPANPVVFVDDSRIKFTMPALKYEGSRPAPFRPMPSQQSSQQSHQQHAHQQEKIELPKNQPAVMSLSDIFSTLEQRKRLEAQGNRVEQDVPELPTTPPTPMTTTTTTSPPPAIVLLGDGQGSSSDAPRIEQSIDLSDRYVQYEVHSQVPTTYPVRQPNGHRPQPPAMDHGGGQYVKYEAQRPQLNVVQFGAVPSMNSVVISPNQQSATFVLGSQQSVGHGVSVGMSDGSGGHFVGSVSQDSASAAALAAPRPSYQMGQVLDEPHDSASVIASVGTSGSSVQVQTKPQDIIKTSSVRFPSESDDQYDNAPIISGTHKSEVLPPNGHSAPVGVRPDQMVVFPPNQDIASTLHEVSNRIVFDSPATSSAAETLNQNELSVAPNPHYPADLPEQLTPPSAPSTRPRPPVPSQGPPFRYNEIHRRPPTYPSERPRPPLTLPNILPQFRPNAKISHGHPPAYLKEPGTYRVKPGGPPLRKPALYPLPTGPVRRAPLPTRLMSQRPVPSRPVQSHPPASAELENRRHYRLPPPPPTMLKDRVFNIPAAPTRLQPPPPPPPPPSPPAPQPSPRPTEQTNEPLPEEGEFHRIPPQILKNLMRDEPGQARPQLEPVVTLQMLQSKKQGSAQIYQPAREEQPPAVVQSVEPTQDRHPVYVVYPVKSTPVVKPGDGSSTGGGQPSKPISPGTEYQNTPFSIASHFDQEPILTAKHKRPGQAPARPSFPYSLEKPDPLALTRSERPVAPARQPQQDLVESESEYNLGEEPSGGVGQSTDDQDLISSKLMRFQTDSTPIAIAYTPTESSAPLLADGGNMRYDKPAGGHAAPGSYYYSPYGETQTEVSYLKIDDVDEFGNPSRRYEQSFQAPFQASMSLDPVKVTNPYEGWAVVTSSPQALKLQQQQQQQPQKTTSGKPNGVLRQPSAANSIDRSDTEDTTSTGTVDNEERAPAVVTPSSSSSASFDPNSFQPELQGGFRPIYGADIKLSEQRNPDPQRSSVADLFAEPNTLEQEDEDGTERVPVQPSQPSTKLQLVEGPASKKQDLKTEEKEPEPGMDLDLEAFFDRLADYDDGEGGLDDVTMSEETTGEPAASDESRFRASEGRSSKGNVVEAVATTTETPVVMEEELTATTQAT